MPKKRFLKEVLEGCLIKWLGPLLVVRSLKKGTYSESRINFCFIAVFHSSVKLPRLLKITIFLSVNSLPLYVQKTVFLQSFCCTFIVLSRELCSLKWNEGMTDVRIRWRHYFLKFPWLIWSKVENFIDSLKS